MELIDRSKLELDTEWSEYYDGYMSYSQSQIDDAEEVKAITLDKIKQAREKMESKLYVGTEESTGLPILDLGVTLCLEILDELINESEK
jgi:hypothetical protein